jgi:cyclic beta-1,2-glucan glucanotransferase
MGTQQQPVFDPNSVVVSNLLRSAPRRREKFAAESEHHWALQGTQLCSHAHLEAESWKICGREKLLILGEQCDRAMRSIKARCGVLVNFGATRQPLAKNAKALVDGAEFVTESSRDAQRAFRHSAKFPFVEGAGRTQLPRVYAAIASYFRAMNYEFEERSFERYIAAVQEAVALEMAELWQLRPCAELVLLERLKAAADEMDDMRANYNLESLAETEAEAPLDGGVTVSAVIASLRRVSSADWKELFERVNPIERILREDPCGAYAQMDFESRDAYRKIIVELAKRSTYTEEQIARKALELSGQLQVSIDDRVRERRSHIGYYLTGKGIKKLEKEIGYRPRLAERAQRFIQRCPDFSYILGIELLTFALIAAAVWGAGISGSSFLIVALFLLPAADSAVSLANQWVTSLFPPRTLPRLDFSGGIPREFATMVVVPTLLTSEEQMKRAVRDLEIRFLANRDTNLHFALLTDPPDSAQQFDDKDQLADGCVHLIQALNAKYAREGKGSFYLFHRHRTYNESEGVWMGWERKRGKLLDFNRLLLGAADNFPVKAGNLSILPEIRYVITVDLDTQLPRDSAHKLVGALAHPLNRAVIDPQTNTVVEGYGILQPRVDISIQSANRSRLAAIFSADAGFDIYARAVSDVYQDLFGEGSFTGKGIYEVKAFQQVLEHRFPCNTILSHDMIEGAYARAGLLSDVEVVDDYPSHMSAFSRRKHRWVRGDWQIIFWLLPRVPNFFGKMERNPLSTISRWKILDNLRRSLTEIAAFVMLLSGWLFFPGRALYWTLATLGVLALPTISPSVLTLLRAKRTLSTATFWKNLGADFAIGQANFFLRLACLCHQSLLCVDAVVRAVVRMTITHERLLEWETAAEAEERSQKKSPFETYLEITPWLAFLVGLFLAVERAESFMAALPLLALWGLSKPVVQWLNLPSRVNKEKLETEDERLLRQSALRTWRLFREFSTAEQNWLVPDTIQEPASLIVHRISTTNLGLLLNSRLAAVDLGFFTFPEFLADTEKTFETIDRMPKLDGQMFNWYDTQTLEPVRPRFVSSVDNGNLVCCLWTIKQGCLGALKERIFGPEQWRGVSDFLDIIAELLMAEQLAHPLLSAVTELQQKTKALDISLAEWSAHLAELERDVVALDKRLSECPGSAEASWWAHELCLRITHLQSLIYDFAPWLGPQFAKQRQHRDIQNIIQAERLTLESLPRLCTTLDRKLARMLEQNDAELENRSAWQLLRSAVARANSICASTTCRLQRLASRADVLATNLDFASMYDAKKKAMSIGFNVEDERLAPYYYDLLASEARAAAFVAIAKGEIPQESWLTLERRYTEYEGERAMLSWTGTMFEYLMPLLWMKTYPNTTLDEATRAAVQCQKKFAHSKAMPWGVSEASCSKLSCDGHFHYEAFGVPALALNREMSKDLVVSPYSTFLSLLVDRTAAIENIQRMKDLGWLGSYGFYEAADFTALRLKPEQKCEIVRCWLAHHQGMSLMAVANVLCDGSSQRRFHAEPRVAATERLLHEKAPRTSQLETPIAEKIGDVPAESLGPVGQNAPTPNWGVSPTKLDSAA